MGYNFYGDNDMTNDGRTGGGKNYNPSIVVLIPERIEHEQQVVDHLMDGRMIIVDFQKTDLETMQRILSFLEGATYGVNGDIVKLRENLILLTPEGMLEKQGEQ
jgi:cell division inhibitor SepF